MRTQRLGWILGTMAIVALATSEAKGAEAVAFVPKRLSPDSRWVGGVGMDFRNVVRRDGLVVLGIGAGLSLLAHPQDEAFAGRLTSSDALEDFLDPGQVIGAEFFLAPATLLVYGAGRVAGNDVAKDVAVQLLRAQLVSQVITHGIKFAADRQRPDGSSYAFPSGHASASFAVAAVLQHRFGWRAGAPAFAAATYVGLSRITEERHWLSDIVFGSALGLAAGHAVVLTDRMRIEPAQLRGGAALELHWRGE